MQIIIVIIIIIIIIIIINNNLYLYMVKLKATSLWDRVQLKSKRQIIYVFKNTNSLKYVKITKLPLKFKINHYNFKTSL